MHAISNRGSNCQPARHLWSSIPNQTKSNSRVGARAKREAAARAKASSVDPLCRFPRHIGMRILELVGLGSDGSGGTEGDIFSGVRDLMACGLVCRKWRESTTLNLVWFKLCGSIGYGSTPDKTFEPPIWTPKDSKVDWSNRYRIKNQAPDHTTRVIDESGPSTPTVNELKHLQWGKEEEEKNGGKFSNKMEARAFYKELGGRKLRNKTGKGSGTDRTGWESHDVHE